MDKILELGKTAINTYNKTKRVYDTTKKAYDAGRNFQKLVVRLSELRDEIENTASQKDEPVQTVEAVVKGHKVQIKHDEHFLEALSYYTSREVIQSLEDEVLMGECYSLLPCEQKQALTKKLENVVRKAFQITEEVIADEGKQVRIDASKC